ncbi:Phosphoribosyl-ATP pyrophosphohydrolase [uncultured virus]|nr:Phosphoribosyl-ATP pyrophosphohydrolase [uncultured virus]
MNQTNTTIIILGNDGTGKTSIVKALREKGYFAWERSVSNIAEYPSNLVAPKEIDKITLALPLDVTDPAAFTNFEKRMFQPYIYWFMIDVDVNTIIRRISNREDSDPTFETPKALAYFRKRYLQFAYSIGIPIISNEGRFQETFDTILGFVTDPEKYQTIHSFQLHGKTRTDLEQYINFVPPVAEGDFLYPILSSIFGPLTAESKKGRSDSIWLERLTEGESKQVYRIQDKWGYFKNKVIIFLKPTIYSHSKQATGEITGLEKIRAFSTNYFQEIMGRNGLNHSYYCVNNNGVILSEQILDIPFIEVVVKRYCAGTDKYSYYGMANMSNFCLPGGSIGDSKYRKGPYVRFDWRNPNHLLVLNGSMRNPVESPWYYLYESAVGKETFFEKFLSKSEYCKPMGDKTLPENLAKCEINVDAAKRNVLKLFYSITHYFRKMNLEIQDACFMIDKTGTLFWSEINQDCMRIKALNGCYDRRSCSAGSQSYDKDLWRTGGSDAKQKILDKWGEFNPLLAKHLTESTFLSEQCYKCYPYYQAVRAELPNIQPDAEYQALYRSILPEKIKRVMVTCDVYNGKPSLVKSGKVVEHHSNGRIEDAMEFLSIFPDMLIVDLNGAMEESVDEKKSNNRQIIKEIATKYYTHCGGGLRALEDVQDVLSASARRVVISTNVTSEFLKQIPKDRLIVELSIDENSQILTHGRKSLSSINLNDTAAYLASMGVQAVSVTFHKTEGHLAGIDKDHVSEVYNILAAHNFQKIYIAGGVSGLDDIDFIWSLGGIPQLGSALWKGKLSIGDIYCAMLSATEDSEIPAIIQSNDGKIKGLIYMNRSSIMKTCSDRRLWRYSRQYGRIMLKGETSGHYQKVLKMAIDCDSDALLITVDTLHPFCHTGNTSCFSLQTSIKGNIVDLMHHISRSSTSPVSYSNRMARYPGLALMKTMEEFWEVVTSEYLGSNSIADNDIRNHKLRECCDFLAHFFMYLVSRNVNIEDVFNELNARRWNPKLIPPSITPRSEIFVIGITGNKYATKTDDFVENILGIRLLRPQGRDMRINYEIVDKTKMVTRGIPTDRKLSFVGIRPKDMPSLMATKKINAVVTYNTVMDNFPKVSKLITSIPDPDLRLALIHRSGEQIELNTPRKILVAAEHPVHVENYLYDRFKVTDKFSLDRVIGSSETFLVNSTSKKYDLCDALVESGRTLKENGLEIWGIILDCGQVTIGYYTHIYE